jgi:hypothetical protein
MQRVWGIFMEKRTRKTRGLNSGFNLLRTESETDLAKILADISQDIGPEDSIERMYVEEVVLSTWDVMRYRRIKTGILDNAFKTAINRLLNQVLLPPSTQASTDRHLRSQQLAYEWLCGCESKPRVVSLLREAGFDNSSIEAEAYMISANDLEKADPMLTSAQTSRDRTLRSIVKYRKSFADLLRRSSDRVLAADEVPSMAADAES